MPNILKIWTLEVIFGGGEGERWVGSSKNEDT